jgi:predicted short-subunit dehydrogenase-like oxidoreductase (DUF2520 family)
VVAAVDGGGGSAARLATLVAGCRAHEDPVAAVAGARLVFVTTSDRAIASVVGVVAAADGWREHHRVVHCSGALGLAPLRRAALAGAGTAAVHPAQSVPAGGGPDVLVGAPWAVTAGTADHAWAHELVVDLGGDPFDLAEDARVRYHAALSLASNAAAAAVAVARDLLLSARVPDPVRVLAPLVESSVANVLRDGAAALTGPVVRGDVDTVAAHLDALDADLPELADDYRMLQSVVLARVRAALDERVAASLDDVLAPPGAGAG